MADPEFLVDKKLKINKAFFNNHDNVGGYYLMLSIFTKVRSLILWIIHGIRSFFSKKNAERVAPSFYPVIRFPLLKRHEGNPVMSPSPESSWEYNGTFNPAAWCDDGGNIHLIYRAVGADGVSRFGYACSPDGLSFSRLPYPVFFMESPRLQARRDACAAAARHDPVMYPSGGSWGGCEDPRMTLVDDRFYLTFSAFDGWDFIRVALTTISKEDFLSQRWKWSKPVFLSPENEIHKNWVVFPEKIAGKIAILSSITPDIQINYIDDIQDIERGVVKIESRFGIRKARSEWDTWPRGVGAPPVKTEDGWLIFYHATDKNEPEKYKLGAMLLDLENPEKVLARSPGPVLTPDLWYENDSKPGVVYVCGVVIVEGGIYVYYGGGDRHVCVAHMPLRALLDWIKGDGSAAGNRPAAHTR